LLSPRYVYDGKEIVRLSKTQLDAKRSCYENINRVFHTVHVNCECGSDIADILAEKDRYGLPVKTVICKKCGLIYQNPRLDEVSSKRFYSSLYRPLYETSNLPAFFSNQLERGKRIINWLQKNTDRFPKRIVEIGCGAGGILKAFQDLGCKTVGFDYDERYISYGRLKGLQLILGDADSLPKHSADLVILSHVLEHFIDVKKELSRIQDLLSTDGCLYVELPGIFNLKEYSYDFLKSIQNAHNYYFTLGTLEQMLSSYGWKLEYGNENIFSLFTYTGRAIGFSKNYYPQISSKLIYFEKMRPMGQLKSMISLRQLLQIRAFSLEFIRNHIKHEIDI
jgi:SAM-dependent methyltransferase